MSSEENQRLVTLQIFGIVTKVIVVLMSAIQGMVVIRIITTAEYGFIGIVLSVASIIGVYQHFGIGVGTLKEVALAKGRPEVSKVFFTSFSARLIITVPVALGLFFFSNLIASGIYNNPELAFGIRLTSFVLIASSIQEIGLNVLNGVQKFKAVFLSQIVYSALNLILIVGFVVMLKYQGYFIGNLLSSLAFAVLLFFLPFGYLRGCLAFPKREEFKKIFKSIFALGLFIYGAKILTGLFNQSGILILGYYSIPDEVGYLRFILAYGAYILAFSNAVNSINLAVMTKKYANDFNEYKSDLLENFKSFFYITFFLSSCMVLFSQEAILLLAGRRYLLTQPLIIFSVLIFFIYMMFEILCACALVSSNDNLGYIYSFIILAVISVSAIFLLVYFGVGKIGVLLGMLAGSIMTFTFAVLRIRKKQGFWMISREVGLLVLLSVPFLVIGALNLHIVIRSASFLIYAFCFWFLSKRFGILNFKAILVNARDKLRTSIRRT